MSLNEKVQMSYKETVQRIRADLGLDIHSEDNEEVVIAVRALMAAKKQLKKVLQQIDKEDDDAIEHV